MSKPKTPNRVRSSELVSLRQMWKCSAKWYRGGGFKHTDELNCAVREGKAQMLDKCADDLRELMQQRRAG